LHCALKILVCLIMQFLGCDTILKLFSIIVGYILASELTGFSSLQLARTDPIGLGIDILFYNGSAFMIQNAFDIDRNYKSKVCRKILAKQ